MKHKNKCNWQLFFIFIIKVIWKEVGDPSSHPNPGSSTGHHLHFEIRNASGYGNDVNPNDYIKFKKSYKKSLKKWVKKFHSFFCLSY